MDDKIFRVLVNPGSRLNLRERPTTSSDVVARLAARQAVARLDSVDYDGWYFIFADTPGDGLYVGYASTDYLSPIVFEDPDAPLEHVAPGDGAATDGENGAVAPAPAPAVPSLGAPSRKALDMIVHFETGGRAYFERQYKGKPVWPQHKSGVTIGVGYDLGYTNEAAFRQEWGGELSVTELDRLAQSIGLKSTGSGDILAQQKAELQRLIREYSDIQITWDASIRVFEATTIPKFMRMLDRDFPNTDLLPPDSYGALLSLVFNRGTSIKGDRRLEMLHIHNHLKAQEFQKIGDEIRAMKRIWPNSQHLQHRRDEEAALFEGGLALV